MRKLILGIGNILMGDEGIGSRVAQFLSEQSLPEDIECIDGGTGGFHLLGLMQDRDMTILIDATADGQQSGTVSKLKPKFSTDYPRTLTAHDIGLKDLLDAFYLLDKPVNITLFAVSIEIPAEPTTELSSEIESLIPFLADLVKKEARII